MSHRIIPRSWFHLNYQKNLQAEREIGELKKYEAVSADASRELVLLSFYENILVSVVMDGIEWTQFSSLCYDPDADTHKLMKEK